MKIKIEFEGTPEDWDKFIGRNVTVVTQATVTTPSNENKTEIGKSNINKEGKNAFEKVENI